MVVLTLFDQGKVGFRLKVVNFKQVLHICSTILHYKPFLNEFQIPLLVQVEQSNKYKYILKYHDLSINCYSLEVYSK